MVDNGINLSVDLGYFRQGLANFIKFSILGGRVSRAIAAEFNLR